ncbi:hypothetical protein BGZ70_000233 [Mortierella alpina]|uniref:BTB domain-containing protein n=1 Tax=Mortierella alpina TaxID=64518 RepID=A0A9P6JCG5_MORAP|nr:hypothetical protein BGZ70_000233 [Mortierella alpina]
MRTAELINLLRSKDRTSPAAKAELAALDSTRFLHLLGELSKWLQVDITKYQVHKRPEYRPQAAIRSQIKQTLLAIYIVLDSAGVVGSGSAPTGTSLASGIRTSKTAIPLDDAQKESILENFLTPLLISIAPLGRDSDTQDVQLLSAKILCFCTNARSKNTPFPPQDVARKMMTLQNRKASDEPSTRITHAIVGLLALLRSPLLKLQDYGLRILSSHRFLVELEPTWQVIAPLTEILESMRDNLITLASDNPSRSQDSDAVMDLEPTESGRSDLDCTRVSQELETTLGIQTKAMSLLQNFLQFAGEKKASQAAFTNAVNSQDRSQEPGQFGKRRTFLIEALRDNPHIALLLDLWRTLQLITLFSRARSPAVERLVLVTSATIYWSCWVFQDHVVSYIMAVGADTLLAWYGYYITSHADPALEPDSTTPLVSQQLPSAADVSPQKEAFRNRCLVLEYITKLIFNICSAKKHHETLFSGPGRVGIVIMRRTLEFLENMLESSLPMVDSSSPEWDEPTTGGNTTKVVTYALEAIQVRTGILEAMLGILSACMGASREGDDLVLQGRLLNLLVLLMSDMEQLLGIEITDSAEQRIRNHTFNLLRSILHTDSALMAIDDVTMDQWTLGYTSLVDMIMLPLERWDRSSVYPPFGDREAKDWLKQGEHQVKVLGIFKLFWKQHIKGRSMLSELFGPRFYRLPMIEVLMGPECLEAGVRINMRERWSSLLFITMLLGTSVRRLEACGYSAKEKLCREVARACLGALRNFWYDRQSLEQLADLDSPFVDTEFWKSHMPAAVVGSEVASPVSIVPLLLTIIAPPGTTWSSVLVLGSVDSKGRPRKRRRHVLLDNQDPLLSEAAWLLSVLARFPGCQQRLISKPGAIWILTRLMVERLLVNLHGPPPADKDEGGEMQMDSAEAVHSSLEKALLITLRRVISAVDLAKAIVSNNTITELFAAILEMDRPLAFYNTKLVCDVSEVDSSRDQILPTPSQHELHVQLLLQFQSAMEPLKGQFERVYQYVGGHRSFQDADETSESVYWLREYCALVFLYASEPPSRASSVASWTSRVDKTALLNSESIFGVACRMLTLEMDYDNDDVEEVDSTHEGEDSQDSQRPSPMQERENLRAQKEAARMRRFSAALAIQSLSWRNGLRWRLQHQELKRSYRNVLTTEREAYIQMLKAEGDSAATMSPAESLLDDHRHPVTFLVQDRVIVFNDRLVLARSSEFFHHLLLGEFKETTQNQIRIRDVEADDFEMLLEVVGESLLTAQHVLPEDLPLSMVLRLMACAERFMVVYIRRLAEAWILNVLQAREMKYYRLQAQSAMDTEASVTESLRRTREESPQAELRKRMRFDGEDGLATVLEELDPSEDEDEEEEEMDRGRYLDPEAEEEKAKEETQESIQECLLMVFEVCSDPRHGDIHSPEHPFYGLAWDVLRRMVLRLGPVALEPRFAALLEQGGEARIQEFLQMLFELVVEDTP